MNPSKMMMTIGLAIAGAGCLTDEDLVDDGADLGTTAQALSAITSHHLTGNAYDTKDLGTAIGRQCFLTGLKGNVTVGTSGDSQAGAGVRRVGTTWQLYVDPASAEVQVDAMCVNTTSVGSTPPVSWSTGQPSQILAAKQRGRQCFLTQIRTGRNATYPHGGFQADSDEVEINLVGDYWRLGGTTGGLVTATAQCFQASIDHGSATVWAAAGLPASVLALLDTDDDAACGFTAIRGHIDDQAVWAATGVEIQRAIGPSGETYFHVAARNASGATARCVE